VWQPDYDRDGQPFTTDESTLTPGGRLEVDRRFFMGFSRNTSPKQRRAAKRFLACLALAVFVFFAWYLVTVLVDVL
jgi:hypothetical protein